MKRNVAGKVKRQSKGRDTQQCAFCHADKKNGACTFEECRAFGVKGPF